ncbi:adenylate kinase [Rhodobacteraceae bacterium G21628-S1]|nr:adenylate kinase [Rhodobacteraceae bacterium G21628-S1]
MTNIILLGPPGAGKGTQASHLVASRNMTQLSTGDMLRAAQSSGSEMGKKVAAIMAEGKLVTDQIVIGLIRERLQEGSEGGFIFDGFPRTLAQADALEKLLAEMDLKLDAVIEMQVDDEVLVKRIVNRAEEARAAGKEARADDNEESVRIRLMEYYKKTSPLIGYYWAKGNLQRLDGMASIDEVQKSIAWILGE